MQPDVVVIVVVVVGISTGIGIFTSSAVVVVTKGAIGMVKRVTDRIKTRAVGIVGTT